MALETLAIVTNIPAPYRNRQFAVLDAELQRHGIRLEVFFLAATHQSRSWSVREMNWAFSAHVGKAPVMYPRPSTPLYLSIGTWWRALQLRPRWLILGGMWFQPSVLALAFSSLPSSYRLFWVEASRVGESYTRMGGLRQRLFRQMDGFVIPGETAKRYVRQYSQKPVLHLPNFVDEEIYGRQVDEARLDMRRLREHWQVPESSLVFLLPARLHPDKGIKELLRVVKDIAGEFLLLLVGEGPQKEEILRIIEEGRIHQARVLGHLSLRQMVEVYALSNALILPSIREAFGFVAVEALWARLPIIISDRAGAAGEVVVNGANGWLVDPMNPSAFAVALAEAIRLGPAGLARMGEKSRELAESRFASSSSATFFIKQVLATFPP